jgi:hypothetical protein
MNEPLTQGDMRQYLYSLRERLPMWTVYDHPTDYPDVYVARLWLSLPEPVALPMTLACPELDPLREELANLGLTSLHRQPGDDPAILETWI